MVRTDGPTLSFNLLSKRIVKLSATILALSLLGGCVVDRPNVDLVLAREAFQSAEEVDAAKYSPANYHRAEESYRSAMTKYKNKAFKEAILDFRAAKVYAERAENSARVQRQKAGEEGL
jgi:hypothetical protein